MSEDVSTTSTRQVDRTTTQRAEENALERKDTEKVKSAADAVGAAKVAGALGEGDTFQRGAAVQPAGLSVPLGAITPTSSPISSEGAVQRMGELGALGNGAAQRFDRSRYNDLISPNPGAPFTGSGATGENP